MRDSEGTYASMAHLLKIAIVDLDIGQAGAPLILRGRTESNTSV
jgi:hypothetical protein